MRVSTPIVLATIALSLLGTGCALAGGTGPQVKSQAYQWRNVEIGGGGGFITGIIYSPTQPDLVYVRTDIGGAYRWDPKAKHWIPLTDWVGQADGNLRGAESLAIDPTNPKRVYLAAGTYSNNTGPVAILRSIDQGKTWSESVVPLTMGGNEDGRSIGERLAVDPNEPSILYFGSRHSGLWRSEDYGVTWSRVASFPTVSDPQPPALVRGAAPPAGGFARLQDFVRGAGVGIVVFDPRSGSAGKATQTIYVAVDSPIDATLPLSAGTPPASAALYRSDDGGTTWTPVPGQPTGLFPHHMALGKDGFLYITYTNRIGPNGISDGAVWKYDTNRAPTSNQTQWTDITPPKPDGVTGVGYAGLALDPQHPGTLVVSTLDRWKPRDEIFRSLDGGSHWEAIADLSVRDASAAPWLIWGNSAPSFGWWIGALALDPFHTNRVLYGTGATIWGTDDIQDADAGKPTHWTSRAEGIEETAVTALVSPPDGAPLISGLGDIGGFVHDSLAVSPPEGMSNNPIFGTTSSIDFAQNQPQDIVRVGSGPQGQNGAYSTNGGKSWTPFPSEPAGSRGSGSIAITANGKTVVWIAGGAAGSYSTNWGATWTASTGLPPAPTGPRSYFGSSRVVVVSDRVEPNLVFAFDTGTSILFRSNDGGVTFNQVTTSLPSAPGSLVASPAAAGDIWVTQNDLGLFHSTDSGTTFNVVPTVPEADGLGFGMSAPDQKYPALYLVGAIGGVHGVFRSDDEGLNWVRINDDKHQYGWIGQPITGDPRLYGRVYLGTNGRGILYADPVPPSIPEDTGGTVPPLQDSY